MQDMSNIDMNELKSSITSYVEKTIHEYLNEKILLYIQDMCVKNNLSFDEQVKIYKQYVSSSYNVESQNKICKGITKSGKICTHKCPSGLLYCKKHYKTIVSEPSNSSVPDEPIVNSYFPHLLQ